MEIKMLKLKMLNPHVDDSLSVEIISLKTYNKLDSITVIISWCWNSRPELVNMPLAFLHHSALAPVCLLPSSCGSSKTVSTSSPRYSPDSKGSVKHSLSFKPASLCLLTMDHLLMLVLSLVPGTIQDNATDWGFALSRGLYRCPV